jgi:hypothetical protein
MGNAIHNLPDRERLLARSSACSVPAASSPGTAPSTRGTYVPGTEKFHQAWVKEALVYVLNRDRELRAQGLPGITRKRGTFGPAFSRRWLLPAEWRAFLEKAGFEVTRVHERDVAMTRRSYETVGSYGGFASAVMAGYPIELACEALQAAVAPALAATGFTTVPARWLEMTGLKPRGASR